MSLSPEECDEWGCYTINENLFDFESKIIRSPRENVERMEHETKHVFKTGHNPHFIAAPRTKEEAG